MVKSTKDTVKNQHFFVKLLQSDFIKKSHQNKNLPKLFSGTVEINPPLNAKACIRLHQLYPTVVELSYSFQTQYVFFFSEVVWLSEMPLQYFHIFIFDFFFIWAKMWLQKINKRNPLNEQCNSTG